MRWHTIAKAFLPLQPQAGTDLRGNPNITFRHWHQMLKLCRLAKFLLPRLGVPMLLSHMAKHDPDLSLLFHALSDPTRRAMLERLARGPATVTELAEPTGLRLPTILRHLAVLEAAGLIATAKDGRVRSCAFVPEALDPLRGWLETQRGLWEARLDRLDDYVMQLMKDRER